MGAAGSSVYVAVATKGRAPEVHTLLTLLRKQSRLPDAVFVVGASDADIEGLADHPIASELPLQLRISEGPGLCIQRNVAREAMLAWDDANGHGQPFSVVFFDDDFRPDPGWLAHCEEVFAEEPTVMGLTGRVLADGIHGPGIAEGAAREFLAGEREPLPHFASGESMREMKSAYGCNMAFRDVVLREFGFDENLPLYGWQEDQDFSSLARQMGRVVYTPGCSGVHLGVKSGRVSGVRFGYSQVANTLYLVRKGTMAPKKALKFVGRHLASNSVRSLGHHPTVDYRGRLVGNLLAFRDVVAGRAHPLRILELS